MIDSASLRDSAPKGRKERHKSNKKKKIKVIKGSENSFNLYPSSHFTDNTQARDSEIETWTLRDVYNSSKIA